MDNYNDGEENFDLPPESEKAYQESPVIGQPLLEQIDYWRNRARFFESQAFALVKRLQEMEESNDGDWWRKMDDDED